MKNSRTFQISNFKFQIAILKNMCILFLVLFMLYTLILAPYPLSLLNSAYAGVESTKHNLSTSGPGPIKAATETQVCIFCHTPHGSVTTPLWNHTMSQASYRLPSRSMEEWSAMLSRPQTTPDGDSRLCLSCHDGTIAIGSVVNLGGTATTVSMQDSGTGYITPEGMLSERSSGYIGTDLSGHHPVSIEVNQSLIDDKGTQCTNNEVAFRVCFPSPPVKLKPTDNKYGTGTSTGLGVQCSSCHDAHEDTNSKFLRETTEDLLCANCHPLCTSGCPKITGVGIKE